ncbi:MAG: hypothetical protein ACUZ8E_07560 [Candidatus Anammoxibacter sp.]
MSPEKIKHLEFIQNVITRMNTNSFQIKGWSIVVASALLAIYASTKNNYLFLAAVFPTLIFWFLDAYYLNQERKFRGLYNDVAGVTDEPKEIKLFAMRPDLYTGGKYSYWSAFLSITILKMYLAMIAILVGIFSYFVFFINKGV